MGKVLVAQCRNPRERSDMQDQQKTGCRFARPGYLACNRRCRSDCPPSLNERKRTEAWRSRRDKIDPTANHFGFAEIVSSPK